MSHRILIIDDLPSIHDDYRTVLESRTCCTEMDNSLNAFLVNPKAQQQSKVAMDVEIDSLSGQQGYEMLYQALDEQRPYELAFVDMRMPPGWNRNTPEVLVSGSPIAGGYLFDLY